jgi:FHS family L-fucose permease-like MFS transporter
MHPSLAVGTAETSETSTLLPRGVMRPFVLATGLFFLWGVPNTRTI